MDSEDTISNAAETLVRFHHWFADQLDEHSELAWDGLTGLQIAALQYLADAGPTDRHTVARRIRTSSGAVVPALAALQKRRFVEQMLAPDHKPIFRVTPAGSELLRLVSRMQQAWLAGVLERSFDPASLSRLLLAIESLDIAAGGSTGRIAPDQTAR